MVRHRERVKRRIPVNAFKTTLSSLIPQGLKKGLRAILGILIDPYAVKTYSQEGEDMILLRMLGTGKTGFYVDVGAHHPKRFSNTYFFYRRGWRGINIEPNPAVASAFQKWRKRDINLQLGVSERAGELNYHLFNDPALNTFDDSLAKERITTTSYKKTGTMTIPVERLDAILKKHLPLQTKIDFLSVDVEGLDESVLKSNDWKRFRPETVLIEALGSKLETAIRGSSAKFLKKQGYELFAKTVNTLIFRKLRS